MVDKFAVGMPELIGYLIGFGLVVADFVMDLVDVVVEMAERHVHSVDEMSTRGC